MAKTTTSRRRHQLAGADLWTLASHDFRQPPQSVSMLAKVLAKPCTDEERRETAGRLSQVAQSLADMVELLSLIARLQSGAQASAASHVRFDRVIGPVIAEVAPAAERSRRKLDVGALDIAATTDRVLLGVAAKGMLLFAIKFAKGPGLLISGRSEGRRVAFDVCYEGPDPAMAISEVAFVELPPGNPDPVAAASERATIARPFVGLGPALLVQLADSMGGSLTHDLTADGRRRLSLLLPAGTKPRGAAAPP